MSIRTSPVNKITVVVAYKSKEASQIKSIKTTPVAVGSAVVQPTAAGTGASKQAEPDQYVGACAMCRTRLTATDEFTSRMSLPAAHPPGQTVKYCACAFLDHEYNLIRPETLWPCCMHRELHQPFRGCGAWEKARGCGNKRCCAHATLAPTLLCAEQDGNPYTQCWAAFYGESDQDLAARRVEWNSAHRPQVRLGTAPVPVAAVSATSTAAKPKPSYHEHHQLEEEGEGTHLDDHPSDEDGVSSEEGDESDGDLDERDQQLLREMIRKQVTAAVKPVMEAFTSTVTGAVRGKIDFNATDSDDEH